MPDLESNALSAKYVTRFKGIQGTVCDAEPSFLRWACMFVRKEVLADAGAPVPQWLQREFVDTGHRHCSGPWISHTVPEEDYPRFYNDGKAYVPYRILKRLIASPGAVVPGSPLAQTTGRSPAMYGIPAKEHP